MSADAWSMCPRCSYGGPAIEDEYQFREDYEIGQVDGVIEVTYRGECQRCGLLVTFTDTRPIPGWPEPNQPTGFKITRPWRAIPAGWFVYSPAGDVFEVLATARDGAVQVVTLRMPTSGREAQFRYSPDVKVWCKRGTRTPAVDAAVDALGPDVDVLDDSVPWKVD